MFSIVSTRHVPTFPESEGGHSDGSVGRGRVNPPDTFDPFPTNKRTFSSRENATVAITTGVLMVCSERYYRSQRECGGRGKI